MVSRRQFKGILAICGGVLIHLSLGTLYTFGEYITQASLEFVNYATVFSAKPARKFGHAIQIFLYL